jgi:hypothetical protein
LPAAFPVEQEEGVIAPVVQPRQVDRPVRHGSELVAVQLCLDRIEEAARIQGVITEELEQGPILFTLSFFSVGPGFEPAVGLRPGGSTEVLPHQLSEQYWA